MPIHYHFYPLPHIFSPSIEARRDTVRIAIIGSGNVGSAIARGLKGKAHYLTLGVRDPRKVAALAADVGIAAMPPAEAAGTADLVVLALPWGAAEAAGALREAPSTSSTQDGALLWEALP